MANNIQLAFIGSVIAAVGLIALVIWGFANRGNMHPGVTYTTSYNWLMGLSTLAIVVGIVMALIFSWMAYNQTKYNF